MSFGLLILNEQHAEMFIKYHSQNLQFAQVGKDFLWKIRQLVAIQSQCFQLRQVVEATSVNGGNLVGVQIAVSADRNVCFFH